MDRIPLFPLSHGVFPDGVLRLQIFEVRYLDLIRRCHRENTPFGVAWLAQGNEVAVPGQIPRLHPMGTLAHIEDLQTVQAALLRVRCVGGRRFRLGAIEAGPFGVWYGEVDYLSDDLPLALPPKLQPLANRLGKGIAQAQAKDARDGGQQAHHLTRDFLAEKRQQRSLVLDLLECPHQASSLQPSRHSVQGSRQSVAS